MQPITIEYIAGFVDGEGSFSIHKTGNNQIQPRFGVYNTNKKVLLLIKEFFSTPLTLSTIKHRNDKWKTLYRLDSHTIDGATSVARLLEPYLIIKKEHAKLIMQFKRANPIHTRNGSLTDFSTKTWNYKLRNKLLILNKKG